MDGTAQTDSRAPEDHTSELDSRAQIVSLWAGLVTVLGLGIALFTAGWIPPPVADQTPAQVAREYLEHQGRIRVGVALLLLYTPLALPFFAVISLHMRDGRRWTVMAFVQVLSGALGLVPTLVATFLWLAATYHPEQRSAGELQLLHDVGWLTIVGTVPPTMLQCGAIAYAVLARTQRSPFPRWVGYYNLWWVLVLIPGLFVWFFDRGPLAWNGLFTFWIGAAFVAFWYPTMFIVLRRMILTNPGR